MNKKTIKEFWDKNKTVIITGVTSCIIGGVIGGAVAKRPRGEAQEFIKQFSEFDIGTNGMSFFADMLKAQEGSTMSFVHNSDVRARYCLPCSWRQVDFANLGKRIRN